MENQIARRKRFFEYRVKIMKGAIPPLQEWAEIEKNNLRHPVHGKLKTALQTLVEREADLARFYSENPAASALREPRIEEAMRFIARLADQNGRPGTKSAP